MKESVSISMLLGCCLAFSVSCGQKKENSALAFFHNAEIQYSEESEKQNIVNALEDAVTLPAEDLAAKRYPDYSGNENQWDLRTLVERHFVPDEQGKTLGDDFNETVKSPEVQEMLRQIKKSLETSEGS